MYFEIPGHVLVSAMLASKRVYITASGLVVTSPCRLTISPSRPPHLYTSQDT
jgi:hypothetical protein